MSFLLVFLKGDGKGKLEYGRIVLSPNLPIKLGIVQIETYLKQPVTKLFMGNAITFNSWNFNH